MGIAEQHAATSAAGLAMGGLHPVVAVYATFLNRAFDQVLLDVAMHRLPVTFVLDRAGITGPDGPSHYGIWDMAVFGVVPGLRIAAPRDAATLREELREAVARRRRPDDRAVPDRRRRPPTCRRCAASAASTCGSTCSRARAQGRAAGRGRRVRATSASRWPPGSPSRATASPWSTRAGSARCRSSWSAWPREHRLVVTRRGRRPHRRRRRRGRPGAARRRRAACRCATSACRPAGTRTAPAPRSSPTSGLTAQDVARQVTEWVSRLDEAEQPTVPARARR